MRTWGILVAALVAWTLAACTLAAPVAAQGRDVQAAARAFEEGQRAQLQGDYAQAAQYFEIAYRAAPAAAAIRAAIRNHRAAGELARAATLAGRARVEFADDDETVAFADEVITQNAGSLGRVVVECSAQCSLSVDGRLATLTEVSETELFVTPGRHRLVASFDGREVTRELEARAGGELTFELEPPAEDPEPDPPRIEPDPDPVEDEPGSFRRDPVVLERESATGLPPAVTWIGLGATALVGAAFVWAFVDLGNASDRYMADPTRERFNRGQDRIRRTAILGATTGALGIATLLIAVLGTDWSGNEDAHPAAGEVSWVPVVSPDQAGIVLRGAL